MLPLDFIREPYLALAQFVEVRLDLLLQLLDSRELNQRIGLLRVMVGHVDLAMLREAAGCVLVAFPAWSLHRLRHRPCDYSPGGATSTDSLAYFYELTEFGPARRRTCLG